MDSVQKSDEGFPIQPKRKKFTWYYDIKATPLVEIYSVTIHRSYASYGLEKCEIYGRIRVVDKQSGYTFDLFDKGKQVAEVVDDVDGTLLLSYPSVDKDSLNVIVPSEHVSLDVELFDKAHGDVIVAKGQLDLDRTVADCKAVQRSKCVCGDVGFAQVHYAEFPYAVVAFVDVLYFSPNDDFDILSDQVKPQDDEDEGGDSDHDSDCGEDRESFDKEDMIDYDTHICESDDEVGLYGTIIASNGLLISNHCDKQDYRNSSILFSKPREKSVLVKSGDYIKLSRCIVNVPVSSSLKIDVDLSDRDTKRPIVVSTVEFKPEHSKVYKKDIVGHNGRIRVRVTWKDAYNRITTRVPPALYSKTVRSPVVELFSIAVCGNDFQPLSYHGKITINSVDSWIFVKDKNCPQYCPALGTHVELNSHNIYNIAGDFWVWVILKDVNSRSIISKGVLGLRPWTEKVWFNRQLCAIIRGEMGFTAVHYAIFPDAAVAKVKVKLFGKTTTSRVSGTLLAYYDIPDFYSSSYQTKYYRSIIFHRDADKDVTLQSDCSNIPLLKSVVMLPKLTSLIFEADLSVSPVLKEGYDSPQETELLKGRISFECKSDGEYRGNISGHDVYIEISGKFVWW